VANRPGLSELAYRVGTHARFKRTMLARMASQAELRTLSTRADDDPSIALVDACATVLDVLTFYQERIANEGYLRTAIERRSVFELAAEIGYTPRPGVAAAGPLAFDLETGPGSPISVTIEAGVKVQSVPGPGEIPQTFETVETVEARPGWNRIPVHAAQLRVPQASDRVAWLEGTATNLRPGDAILLVGRERDESAASDRWDFRLLTEVDPDPIADVTRIAWADGLGWRDAGRTVLPAAQDVRCYAFRQRAALFGAAAPDYLTLVGSLQGASAPRAAGRRTATVVSYPTEWPNLTISAMAKGEAHPDRTIFLDALYPRLVTGSWIVLQRPGYAELYRPDPRLGAGAIADDARTGFTLSAKTTRVVLQGENLLTVFNSHIRDTVVFLASEELALAATPIREPVEGRTVEVDDPLEGFALGRTVVVRGPRARLAVRERTRPTLRTTAGGAITLKPRDVLTVLQPSTSTLGVRSWLVETGAGDRGVVDDPEGDERLIPVPAPDGAELVAEARVVDLLEPVAGSPGRVKVRFSDPLASAFDRRSTVVLANVALATHGETKHEILGSGDGSAAYQAFRLKGAPLTHVPAPTVSGEVSTLRVDVDDIRWIQVPGLDGAGPRGRLYVAATADDGTTTVRFGDGRLGARLPAGVENVRATYRVGIGAGGNLGPEKLTLLMTRPLGVRGVSNPLATTGGADPESRDDARVNAPRTVLTFDRVVSLDDVANVARSFATLAKAEARWIWDGRTQVVLVTVAGAGGLPVAEVPTMRDLAAAIRDAGDPHLPIRFLECDRRAFDVDLGIFVAPDHDPEIVTAAVRAALLDAFSFERRELAQSVTVSEVGSMVQGVAGVVAVDLNADGLRIDGEAPPSAPVLIARPGRATPAGPRPAELLTVNALDGGIRIGVRE
jgi:hypothetical protein